MGSTLLLLDGGLLKSMSDSTSTTEVVWSSCFFQSLCTLKGNLVLVVSEDILSRLVKPWMREEKSVNREILLEENTGLQQEVL